MGKIVKDFIDMISNISCYLLTDICENVAKIVAVLIGIIGVISGVVDFIIFVVNGGYGQQMETFQTGGINAINDMFSGDAAQCIQLPVLKIIIVILLCIQIVNLIILFFDDAEIWQRVTMVISLVLATVTVSIPCVLFGADSNKLCAHLGQKIVLVINELGPGKSTIIYIIVGLISIISFLVLVFTNDAKWVIGYTAIAMAITYIATPLVILLLKNILPLILWIIILAFVAFIVWIMLKSRAGTSNRVAPVSTKKTEQKDRKVNETPTNEKETWNLSGDVQLWVETNITNAKVIRAYSRDIMGDGYHGSIYYDLVGDVFLNDFKKGKIEIKINGKRATEKDLHYGKKN